MERLEFKIPLLIGGATTSRVHTAVKIAQHYSGPVVHVNDASKSVPVASSLISDILCPTFMTALNSEYEYVREQNRRAQGQNKFISLAEARTNKTKINWNTSHFHKPTFLGTKVFSNYSIEKLVPFIDWTPFFHTWEMKGSYPKILADPLRGEEAKKLFDDAQSMLQKIIAENWLSANGVIGFWPANTINDDDIEVYEDDTRTVIKTVLHTLRQQTKKPANEPNIALADFIAPKGHADYIGGFAVSTGFGIDDKVAAFEKDHDEYSSIMLKAIADRLAEAFSEYMHQLVRKEMWAYAKNEILTREELVQEEYVGIRPAQGYPACPEHTEKKLQFELLEVYKNTGITLTESYAMVPTAAVSGLYFSHPQSNYFGLGKITKEQVQDYAKRKGMNIVEAERWLSPNLGY